MATWVLLHGTPLTPGVWDGVRQELSDQAVVTPDCTRVPGGTNVQGSLAAQVADTLPQGRWDVVGHSFGGQIALELALGQPDRVRSLTIFCSRDTPFPAFAAVADAVRTGHAPTVEAGLARWFRPEELSADGPAVRAARGDLQSASAPDWANALAAIATYDRSADLRSLSMRVSLHAAAHDAVSTPEVMAAFATHASHAALQVHDGWAHMSPFVDPAALAALLRAGRDRAAPPSP